MKQPMGHRLRKARVKSGYSRDGATERANRLLPASRQFVPVTLTRIENGTIAQTDVAIVAALSRVYRSSLKDFDVDPSGGLLRLESSLTQPECMTHR